MNIRRKLVVSLATGILAPARGSIAQQPVRAWRVGILPAGLLAPRQHQWDAYRQRMRELGYVEGRNIEYVFRPPASEGAKYDDLAAELVQQKVDVIVANSTIPIEAAKRATRTIPIIMCPSTDPVGFGFVASLARPGGNITGIAVLFEETTGKRLQLLREMLPKATRVAVLWNALGGKPQMDAAVVAARQLGLKLQSLEVGTEEALPAAFEAAVKGRAEALMVASNGFTFGLRSQIAALALKHRLPTIYPLPANADAGGLVTYGPNDTEFYRQGAVFTDRILKGARPADMPVEQPTRFELVINMKTARALGVTVPQALLMQAERVIE